jgi:hypothetical protein
MFDITAENGPNNTFGQQFYKIISAELAGKYGSSILMFQIGNFSK